MYLCHPPNNIPADFTNPPSFAAAVRGVPDSDHNLHGLGKRCPRGTMIMSKKDHD
jgi:hypothetical protein